jgi:hypothetical protein
MGNSGVVSYEKYEKLYDDASEFKKSGRAIPAGVLGLASEHIRPSSDDETIIGTGNFRQRHSNY